MAWQEPKTDWHPSNDQGVDGDDFNRIEENTKQLYDTGGEGGGLTFRLLIGGVSQGGSIKGFWSRVGGLVTIAVDPEAIVTQTSGTGVLELLADDDIPNLYSPWLGAVDSGYGVCKLDVAILQVETQMAFYKMNSETDGQGSTFRPRIQFLKYDSPTEAVSIDESTAWITIYSGGLTYVH